MTNDAQMQRQATSYDVARQAGVSRSAVSRAFTPGASISKGTRAKVIRAADELGYRVNHLAKSLSNRRSDLVGLIVADLDNPFRAAQIDALARELVANGYRPLLFPTGENFGTAEIVHLLLHYSLSGVVVTSDAPPTEICAECVRTGVPLVLVNKEANNGYVDRVTVDNVCGGGLAANALIDAGCKDLVALRPSRRSYSIESRISGFRERGHHVGLEVTIFDGDLQTYEGGRSTAARFVEHRRQDTGVFCPTDYMALGFLDALVNEHAIAIPGDLQLIGYDNIPQSGWSFAKLTTISQPVDQLASAAVSLLIDRINNPNADARVKVVPVELVLRDTTS